MINNSRVYSAFIAHIPQLLPIRLLDLLPQSKLYLCGEVHGARQNADIIWTLCHSIGVRQLALEYSTSVDIFIQHAVHGDVNVSLLNFAMLDRSILSIEMLKTIVELLRTGIIDKVVYIDETFDYTSEQWQKITDPDWREAVIAHSITQVDLSNPALCVMGNWHTRSRKTSRHISALYRVRQTIPQAVLIKNVYRTGAIYNAGETIRLAMRYNLPEQYTIIQRTKCNFDMVVPMVQEIWHQP